MLYFFSKLNLFVLTSYLLQGFISTLVTQKLVEISVFFTAGETNLFYNVPKVCNFHMVALVLIIALVHKSFISGYRLKSYFCFFMRVLF